MATRIHGRVSILSAMALCCTVSVFSAESKKISTAPVQPKTSVNSTKEQSETKELEAVEKDIVDIDSDTRKEAAKAIGKLALSKKVPWISYTAKALLADYYIEEEDLKKAADVLRDCNDYTKIGASKDTDHGTAYLKCFLECAKLEAAKKNIAEALKMANYAEGKTDGIDKILVYCKYGEILGLESVGQPENAKKYFEKALKICNEKLKKLGDASVGEAKEDISTERRSWNKLKLQISEQQQKLISVLLAKEYGGDYSTYYLMMSAFYAKNYIKAQFYANKILQSGEKSIYTDAAQFHHAVCTMNVPEAKKSSKVSAGIKTAEAELKKFIKDKPYGDYRGDALMSLGAMELEHNYNMKAAEKYYDEALAYFKHQRELKDATDLFVIPDKVKEISTPKGKSTYLDQWNRTVCRKISPLEIITIKSAPWMIDEKEKECCFIKGFFLFMDGNFNEAEKCFGQVSGLDANIAMLEACKIPNTLMRLKGACKQGFLIARPEEMEKVKGKFRMKTMLGDLMYITEQYEDGYRIFESITKDSQASEQAKAYGYVGMGNCLRLRDAKEAGTIAMECYKKSFHLYPDTVAAANAMMSYAYLLSYSDDERKNKKAFDTFYQCFKKYPNTIYGEEALCRLVIKSYGMTKNDFTKFTSLYKKKYPNGNYTGTIDKFIIKYQKEGEKR